LLISRAFTILMIYRVAITVSYQIFTVAVGWHIFELTQDVMALGLIGLAEVIPYFCCALFAGHAVDVLPKKKIALFGCAVYALMGAVMLWVATGDFQQNWLKPAWLMYFSIGLAGIARAVVRPIYQVLFAQALERSQYSRGTAVGTSVFQMAQIGGPAFGGVLIAWSGLVSAYLSVVVFALIGVMALLAFRYQEEVSKPSADSIWVSIVEGLKFVFGRQVMLAAMALDMFAVLFGGAVSMLPAYVSEILSGHPEALGLLRAAPAVGSTLVGLWLARRPLDQYAGRWLLAAVAGFGLSAIGFGVSTTFVMAALSLLFMGVFDGISVIIRSTIMQLLTPDNMRGRVSAINGIFIGSSNEIGALESGIAASWLGLSTSIVFGGVVTLLVVMASWFLAPKLRYLNMRDLQSDAAR
jgi:MFS family permease